MKKIISSSGNVFISDNFDNSNEVWRGNYIWLFCNRAKTPKSISFQYTSVFFKNVNMIKASDVLSVTDATEAEENIFKKIKSSIPISKDDQTFLKANYLKSK